MSTPDVSRLSTYRAGLAARGLHEVTRFAAIRKRLDRWGLRPTPGCRYRRDPDSGRILGLHLVLGFRDDVDDWLVKIPFHLSWALRKFGYRVVGTPHLCSEASWFLGRRVVVIQARKRRRKAA